MSAPAKVLQRNTRNWVICDTQECIGLTVLEVGKCKETVQVSVQPLLRLPCWSQDMAESTTREAEPAQQLMFPVATGTIVVAAGNPLSQPHLTALLPPPAHFTALPES